MSDSKWWDKSWNPVTGCTPISKGCRNCYARVMHNRLRAMGCAKYQHDFGEVTCHPDLLEQPLSWKKPQRIFVNSMSDLFNDAVDWQFIGFCLCTMRTAKQHKFLICTKRAENMYRFSIQNIGSQRFAENIWAGVTVENRDNISRIECLKKTKCYHRFISFEPLLRDVGELDLRGIDWVIIGGETGKNARPMKASWVENIVRQADFKGIPVFFKQMSSYKSNEYIYLLPNSITDRKEFTKELIL